MCAVCDNEKQDQGGIGILRTLLQLRSVMSSDAQAVMRGAPRMNGCRAFSYVCRTSSRNGIICVEIYVSLYWVSRPTPTNAVFSPFWSSYKRLGSSRGEVVVEVEVVEQLKFKKPKQQRSYLLMFVASIS
jgi:hypothetical protein